MKITSPLIAYEFFKVRIRSDIEEFWAASLNAEKLPTAATCLFRGTVDHCLFHPRDVFRFAILNNACSLVVAHSHPSGNPRPSTEDLAVTAQLQQIAIIMEIPLVDHIIIGGNRYYSFLENKGLRLDSTDPVSPCGR